MKIGIKTLVVAASTVSICLNLGSAMAQTAGEPAAPEGERTGGQKALQSITVTAERRAENPKDVPNAVSILSGELIDAIETSGQDLRVLTGRLPSLNVESSFGRAYPRFYIRGFGNTDFDLNSSQPVSLLVDDVVQESPMLKGFPMFDIEQVEVLRGPQGTLFGRNSPAGVVKFESVKPVLGRAEGYASATAGSFGTLNLEGAYSVPLGETSAMRVSVLSQHRDDWVKNTFPGANRPNLEGYTDRAIRLQYLYKPSNDFSALFNVHGRDLDGTARLFRANIIKPGTNDLIDGFNPNEVTMDGDNFQIVRTNGMNVRLQWGIGDLTLHSITAFEHAYARSRSDVDGGYGAVFAPPSGPGVIPFPSEAMDELPSHRQITQEFRLQNDTKADFNWLTGVYFFDEDITVNSFSYDSLNNGAQNGLATQHQRNRSAALFGSVRYKLTDRLSVRGGLRYTTDRKDYSVTRTQSPLGAGPISATANPSAHNVSWDVSSIYALTQETNVYARVATGFRAPSIQGRLLYGDTISVGQSEKAISYEAGVKSELFEHRARVAFNVYKNIMRDQQLTARKENTFYELINADKTTGQGFELELQVKPTERLLLSLSAAYNQTRINDPRLVTATCMSCTSLDPAAPGGGVYIDGNPLPQSPRWTGYMVARYGIPMESGGELYAMTDWTYRGTATNSLQDSVEFKIKPLLEGGLRIGYISADGRQELALFGRNITNQVQVIGGVEFNNLAGLLNEPRTWGVQYRVNF